MTLVPPSVPPLTPQNHPGGRVVATAGDAAALAAHPALKYGAPATERLRAYEGFVSCLDGATRNPKWVLEHVTRESLRAGDGVTREQSLFHEDGALEARFRAKLSDYQDSGYDRGHLAPAANHKASQRRVDETFSLRWALCCADGVG